MRTSRMVRHSSLLKPYLEDRPPLFAVLHLVVRARRIVRCRNSSLGAEELFNEWSGFLEVSRMIGDENADAVILQDATHFDERLRPDDAALLLARPRPGIGKVDVQLRDRAVAEHLLHD